MVQLPSYYFPASFIAVLVIIVKVKAILEVIVTVITVIGDLKDGQELVNLHIVIH